MATSFLCLSNCQTTTNESATCEQKKQTFIHTLRFFTNVEINYFELLHKHWNKVLLFTLSIQVLLIGNIVNCHHQNKSNKFSQQTNSTLKLQTNLF
jgi:hypothetical protein